MKRIGTTEDDNVILECTESEYRSLEALDAVAKGAFRGGFGPIEHVHLVGDFTAYFTAVRRWISIQNGINLVRDALNEAEKVMNSTTSGEPNGVTEPAIKSFSRTYPDGTVIAVETNND